MKTKPKNKTLARTPEQIAGLRYLHEHRARVRAGKSQLKLAMTNEMLSVLDEYIGIAGTTRQEVAEQALETWCCDAIEALPQLRANILAGVER
jgi:hypothetical protein